VAALLQRDLKQHAGALTGSSTRTGQRMRQIIYRFKTTPTGRRLVERPVVSAAWLRVRSLPHYARRGHIARSRIVRRYVAETDEPRLQLGTGPGRLAGWLNSDVVTGDVYLDIGRRLPIPDNTFAFVFTEHVIEHIPETAGERLLRELHRILKPGGVARITTPDLRKIIALYEDQNPAISRSDYARFLDEITGRRHDHPAQLFNDFMRLWGHYYLYDEEDLTAKLLSAGFVGVKRCKFGDSEHDFLRGLESHGPDWENDAEAMSLEATRPE
jgi:predicted SAM-dependent methyltransferase